MKKYYLVRDLGFGKYNVVYTSFDKTVIIHQKDKFEKTYPEKKYKILLLGR